MEPASISGPSFGRDQAFAAVNAAFGSLGRVCMALDGSFRVRHVSMHLDRLLGEGAAARIVGQPIEQLLGPELFGAEGPIREALLAGEKREGWRALLRGTDGSRLLSVTVAPLQHDPHGVCDPDARYLLVLRPADEESAEVAGTFVASGLMCRSPSMSKVLRLVESLQHSETSVLITGESGTGKEVIARTIHAHSPRRNGPFVAVNSRRSRATSSRASSSATCAAPSPARSRTGRGASRPPTGGTLFLDEVGDLPLHAPGEAAPRPPGARARARRRRTRRAGRRPHHRRDQPRPATRGRRRDASARTSTTGSGCSRSRSRRCASAGRTSRSLARVLLRASVRGQGARCASRPTRSGRCSSYSWPGNVRELENALEFAVTVSRGQTLQPEDLPPEVLCPCRPEAAGDARAPGADEARASGAGDAGEERASLQAALEANRWSRAETARALGVSRSTLWRRMRAVGLE